VEEEVVKLGGVGAIIAVGITRLSTFRTFRRLVSMQGIREYEPKALDFDPAVQWDVCRSIWVVDGVRGAPIVVTTIAIAWRR
jgi:hypothetical protein